MTSTLEEKRCRESESSPGADRRHPLARLCGYEAKWLCHSPQASAGRAQAVQTDTANTHTRRDWRTRKHTQGEWHTCSEKWCEKREGEASEREKARLCVQPVASETRDASWRSLVLPIHHCVSGSCQSGSLCMCEDRKFVLQQRRLLWQQAMLAVVAAAAAQEQLHR